jgi:hypothetical protein
MGSTESKHRWSAEVNVSIATAKEDKPRHQKRRLCVTVSVAQREIVRVDQHCSVMRRIHCRSRCLGGLKSLRCRKFLDRQVSKRDADINNRHISIYLHYLHSCLHPVIERCLARQASKQPLEKLSTVSLSIHCSYSSTLWNLRASEHGAR